MDRASAIVLDGAIIRAKQVFCRNPDRFRDDKGAATWDRILEAVNSPVEACVGVT
jgi:hypothetical protein